MAGSRMEKLSTIFQRYAGLIKTGAVPESNRPLWYDVYQHFPPSIEPLAIRPKPVDSVRPLYYREDLLRAEFFRSKGDRAVVHDFISTKADKTELQKLVESTIQQKKSNV